MFIVLKFRSKCQCSNLSFLLPQQIFPQALNKLSVVSLGDLEENREGALLEGGCQGRKEKINVSELRGQKDLGGMRGKDDFI